MKLKAREKWLREQIKRGLDSAETDHSLSGKDFDLYVLAYICGSAAGLSSDADAWMEATRERLHGMRYAKASCELGITPDAETMYAALNVHREVSKALETA
jgi:hypothetical protein